MSVGRSGRRGALGQGGGLPSSALFPTELSPGLPTLSCPCPPPFRRLVDVSTAGFKDGDEQVPPQLPVARDLVNDYGASQRRPGGSWAVNMHGMQLHTICRRAPRPALAPFCFASSKQPAAPGPCPDTPHHPPGEHAGAKGDGTTDDTNAFIAASQDNSWQGVLNLPAGTYL